MIRNSSENGLSTVPLRSDAIAVLKWISIVRNPVLKPNIWINFCVLSNNDSNIKYTGVRFHENNYEFYSF